MDESEQIKEVYARFGVALYLAQVIEHQIVSMLVAGNLQEKHKTSRQEIDSLFDTRFSQTMGMLMGELKQEFNLSEKEKILLDLGLKERNRLAHKYFREKAVDFMNDNGRARMIEELSSIAEQFQNLDKILTHRHREFAKKYGINEESVQREIDSLLGRL